MLDIEPERITADDLTADEDGELLAIVAECLEDPASFEPFVDSFIAGATEGGTNLTRSEARCIERSRPTGMRRRSCVSERRDPRLDRGSGDRPAERPVPARQQPGVRRALPERPDGSDTSIYGMTCANRLPEGTGFTCFDELG